MSLHGRITLAAALAVAAIATGVAATGYLSTRSHLRSQVDQTLVQRAMQYVHPDGSGSASRGGGGFPVPGSGGPSGRSATGSGAGAGNLPAGLPPGPGGAPPAGAGGVTLFGGTPNRPASAPPGGQYTYFQFVYPGGRVVAPDGGKPLIASTQRARSLAAAGRGKYFTDQTVDGAHWRVLTVADASDHDAVQVGLSLAADDRVLHSLLISYALIVGGGIVLALVLGWLIGRTALRPVVRFTRRTEAITDAVDVSQRLEETGAGELARLAASFNRTLDALERSVQAQRHLVADASHELRTPLAALRSNIQIFIDAERLPLHERVGLQEAIVAELDELTQLVADVVELARGTPADARVEEIELDQIVREAVERVRRRAPGLRLHVELEPTEIVNNAERTARAATNLLDNARKWSPPEGVVEVTLAGGVLTVRDHGPGFKPRDLPYVFDRFYRADAARSMPGSGLGLAIVRQAAESYGGHAQAGNAEGGGAVLTVRFGSARPLAKPSAAPGAAPAQPVRA